MPYKSRSRRGSGYRSKGRRSLYRKRRGTGKRRRPSARYSRRSRTSRARTSRSSYRSSSYRRGRRSGARTAPLKRTAPTRTSFSSASKGRQHQVVCSELAAVIGQPITNPSASDQNGIRTREVLRDLGDSSNIVNQGSAQQFVTLPNPKNVVDPYWPCLTTQYTSGNNVNSYPSVDDLRTPYYIFDAGKSNGEGDKIYFQNGFFALMFSPQAGQLVNLAKNAQGCEQYRIDAIRVRYEPVCGTTTEGILVMYVEPNPTQAPEIRRKQMLAQRTAVTGSLYTPHTLLYYNPDKSFKWCTSPAKTSEPSGQNGNRLPDRFSDSMILYFRIFDAQKSTNLVSLSNLGYLYVDYAVTYKSTTTNSNLIADPDAIMTTADGVQAAMELPPVAPAGLVSSTFSKSLAVPVRTLVDDEAISDDDESTAASSDCEPLDWDDLKSPLREVKVEKSDVK